MTDIQTEEQTVVFEELEPYEDDGSKDRLTHIVNPPSNNHVPVVGPRSAKSVVDTARFLRMEIVALCGHRFVPVHNPEKYDVCKSCMDVAGMIMKEDG